MPLALMVFFYSVHSPRFTYLLYAFFSYYLIAIMRYSYKTGLSVILDIILVFMLITILFRSLSKNQTGIHFQNAVNCLTVGYLAWMIYILIQFGNPLTKQSEIMMASRQWLLSIPILYIMSGLLADNLKMLRTGLVVLGIFTITAFIKLLYQKYFWFDAAETTWLMQGSWITHIIPSGIRYFSLFSDAGNYGASMGMITIVYLIVTFYAHRKRLRIFYAAVAVMGAIGMFMSGTRGAMIVPMGGLALYCLLSKNVKIMFISLLAGGLLYSFFAFTDIGDDNPVIRRMRTAFKPSDDASFNVRIENQAKIAEFLKTHPWGAGVGGGVPRIRLQNGQFVEDNIPPDAFYVDIWMQTGNSGLIVYLSIYIMVLLRCCYIVMFRIKDKELRYTLAALMCGVFGMWLNGYVGQGMGMPPNNFLIAAALAFTLNGPYIDKQLSQPLLTINS
jgi:hypothetical protein